MKKAIKITTENADKINDAIIAAEGRARVRCISAEGIEKACAKAFDHFDITKKALEGVKISVDIHAQHFPNAYKYTPESTQFCAVYKRGAWYLTDIYRGVCRAPSQQFGATLTEAATDAIIRNFSNF